MAPTLPTPHGFAGRRRQAVGDGRHLTPDPSRAVRNAALAAEAVDLAEA